MASPAQITANRANAQRSTGPRSAEGKSASSMNALKHGVDANSLIIPGEDRAEYDGLAESYNDELKPISSTENFHVEAMIRADWQKRRFQLIEADLFRILTAEVPGQSLAEALLSNSPTAKLLARTQRQIAAHDRTWYRAQAELRRERKRSEQQAEAAFESYLDQLTVRSADISELASIRYPRESAHTLPAMPAVPAPARSGDHPIAAR